MTAGDLVLCLAAVVSSSAAQLCLKGCAARPGPIRGLLLLSAAGLLMALSIAAAVYVLRTVGLSQLVPFAAAAYILVPLGSRLCFGDHLPPRFWAGVAAILLGVLLATT